MLACANLDGLAGGALTTTPEAGVAEAEAGPGASDADADGADGAGGTCSLKDDFERETPVGGIWTSSIIGGNSVLEMRVSPSGTALAASTPTGAANAMRSAYLIGAVPNVPRHLHCSFAFEPDVSFANSTGYPVDIFQIDVVHADGSAVVFRVAYRNGQLELRDDELDPSGACSGRRHVPCRTW